METILSTNTVEKYKNSDRAGVRDWILNHFYDPSIYSSGLCDSLTEITIFHDEEYILGLELYYDNVSTGVFHGLDYKKNDKVFKKSIKLKENDFVKSILGSFNNDYITELVFCLSSGEKLEFANKLSLEKTDNKHFNFSKDNCELFSLKMAFGKYLTFLSPVFKEHDNKKFRNEKIGKHNYLISNLCGKNFDDSMPFSYYNEIENYGDIKLMDIYHDGALVKGIKLIYGESESFFGNISNVKNLKCESMKFDQGEEINFISIRSGDMIDNITIHSTKGKCISAGGHGGGQQTFELNKKTKFCGFSGSHANNFHSIQIVVKEII